ncbi:pseudouridine synthase [Cyathus striatus]|nr:pseudouridine synthase [Cyathus striatus]
MSDSSVKRKAEEPDSSPLKRVKLGESVPLIEGNNTSEVTSVGESSSTQLQGKGREKYTNAGKKNNRSRPGRRGTRNQEEEDKLRDDADRPRAPRYPKRQCALLIGFCGSGYSGMQIQPEHAQVKTIEGVLFKALVKIGAVSQDNADDPVKVALARAARTDAGVHAAGNVVSLKMIVTIPGVRDIVERLNEELPPEIRVWGYTRVQNSFNARLVCDSRKYTYYFPSYLLIPPKRESGLQKALRHHLESSMAASDAEIGDSEEFWKGDLTESRIDELTRKRAWRVGSETMERLRSVIARYEGTHNFHNFTVARDASDKSNNRFIKKIEITDPVIYGGTEWISILIHGQSFMLHQRKMMAALVLICRCGTPIDIIDQLYKPSEVFIPKMPALGLLLEEPLFHSYNTRVLHREKMAAFKEKYIYTNMREVEDRDGIFDAWMRSIDTYAGNDFLYLGKAGTLPQACIIKRGVRRENPFKERKLFDATSFPTDGDADQNNEDADTEDEDTFKMDKKHLAETEG